MASVDACEIPPQSLLDGCRERGAWADCHVAVVDADVPTPAFVEAFYTTPLFRLERALLAGLAARPSTDDEATQLAHGERETFAAWRVEGRTADELLVRAGRTHSWFMARPEVGAGARTRLHFGSAVDPRPGPADAPRRMGAGFHALLGFHRLYSRALLSAAVRRLAARATGA